MQQRSLLVDLGQISFGVVFQMERRFCYWFLYLSGFVILVFRSSIYFSSMLWQLSNYCFQLVQLYDIVTGNVICHGEENLINDGHKSFPSGHTSCKLFLILASFAAFSQVHDFLLWRRNARYVLTIIFDNF